MQIAWIEDKYLFRLRMDNKLRVKGILLFQPFNFILQTKLSTSLYNLFMVRWWCFCVLPFFSHHPISNTPNGNLFYTHIKFGGHFFVKNIVGFENCIEIQSMMVTATHKFIFVVVVWTIAQNSSNETNSESRTGPDFNEPIQVLTKNAIGVIKSGSRKIFRLEKSPVYYKSLKLCRKCWISITRKASFCGFKCPWCPFVHCCGWRCG